MRNVFVVFLISLALFGCSKKPVDSPPNDGLPHNVTTNSLPFAVTVVETAEAKASANLVRLARSYLEAKDYAKLDELASQYRSADEVWPDGNWKLVAVYDGLALSADEPDSVWLARQKVIQEWMQARPASITARVALARNLAGFAWKARGGGYANTVSDAAEKLFEERLNQAATVLTGVKDLKETCPVYWSTLMKIALGLGVSKTQFDHIFQQAIQAWPDYLPNYVQRATFLLPRWYGNAGEWEADLGKNADLIGGKKGDMVYAQVVWSMMRYSSEHHNVFEDNPRLSWERVDRGLDSIEQKFPDSLEVVNIHAHLAALAGDKEKAKKFMLKTGGQMVLNEWSAKGEFIDCVNWALGQ
jgi:hypothetical protein